MGKASRNKRAGTAREKIAAQRAAARRAELRNRVFMASGAVVVVIAIVVAFVLVKANAKSPSSSAGRTTLSASTIANITGVPAATLDAVGAGAVTVPKPIVSIPGTSLTANSKPEVLYVGAEYCPYCATERWAMAVALSRFGTFTGLRGIQSSTKPGEPFPGTHTLTFHGSTYTSRYITFVPVETLTVDEKPLDHITAAQNALVTKYDGPPYVQGSPGAIPFIDFGNQFVLSGATYNPAVLQSHTWTQIATALHDPSSPIAKGALGSANYITAAICKLTHDQPASACTPVVKALEAKI
ncbi:MAG TPA: DUF929 family protein [Streptosporangiaceae bacterium]|nr:DUF929 family protein [Streptosporangiaceae bacterium]